MHQDNGWDLPDLQFLGGISVGLAVSAEHLVVVSQPLFLGEKPQAILPTDIKHLVTYCTAKKVYCTTVHFNVDVLCIIKPYENSLPLTSTMDQSTVK